MLNRLASGVFKVAKVAQSSSAKLISIRSTQQFARGFADNTQFDVLNPVQVNEKPKVQNKPTQRKPMNKTNRPPRQMNKENNNNNMNNGEKKVENSNRNGSNNNNGQYKKRPYGNRSGNRNGNRPNWNSNSSNAPAPASEAKDIENVYVSKKPQTSNGSYGMKSINEFKYPNLENKKEKPTNLNAENKGISGNNENRPQKPRFNRNSSNNFARNQKLEKKEVVEEEVYPDVEIPEGPFNLPFPDEVKENLLTKEVKESEMFEDMKDKSTNPFEITEGEDIESEESKWRKDDYNFNGAKIEIETRQFVAPRTKEMELRGPLPENRKVILRVHVKDLKLPIMAAQKLVLLSGPRYNFKNDVLTITTDRYPLRRQNARWLVDTLENLIQEASVPTPLEEVPEMKPIKTASYPYPIDIYNSTK